MPREFSQWEFIAVQQPLLLRLAGHDSSRGNQARDLAADPLVNRWRRMREGAVEDSLLRAYRALKMLGQARLFDCGLGSEKIDQRHPEAARCLAGPDAPVRRRLGRHEVVGLLRHLGDGSTVELGRAAHCGVWRRNHSILVHGFRAEADRSGPHEVLNRVTAVFLKEDPKNRERGEAAQFPKRSSVGFYASAVDCNGWG